MSRSGSGFRKKLHGLFAKKQRHSDRELVLVGTDGETAAHSISL